MAAKLLRKCPACGKSALKRLIGGGAGVIFKGSGFYQTDYKKSKSPEPVVKSDSSVKETAAKEKSSSKDADSGSSACKSSKDTSSSKNK